MPPVQKECTACGGLAFNFKTKCGDCGGKKFRPFKHKLIRPAVEDDDDDDGEEDGDDDDKDTGARGGVGPADDSDDDKASVDNPIGDDDDSSSDEEEDADSDDSSDEASKKLKRNENDRAKSAAARALANTVGVPYANGPRTRLAVVTDGVVKVGDTSEDRDEAELRIMESFEAASALPFQVKREGTVLLYICLHCKGKKNKKQKRKRTPQQDNKTPSVTCCRHRAIFNSERNCWVHTVTNPRECSGSPGRDDANAPAATTAYSAKMLVALVVRNVKPGEIKPRAVTPFLLNYCNQSLSSSFVKRVCASARGTSKTKG